MKSLLMAAVMALPCAAGAQEVERKMGDFSWPPAVEAAGKKLVLNGLGIRTKVVFKVYVGALYLEARTSDPKAVISSLGVRRMELAFLRGVGGKTIAEAIEEGFRNNAGGSLPSLKERLEAFRRMIPDLKKADRLSFTSPAGKGVEVSFNGKPLGAVDGRDFADALFSVWLGDKPADAALKKGLLAAQ